jgi:hypothetical protein
MTDTQQKPEWDNSEFRGYCAGGEKRAFEVFVGQEDEHRYGPKTIRDILNNYNLQDLGI